MPTTTSNPSAQMHAGDAALTESKLSGSGPSDINAQIEDELRIAALEYHRLPTPGKVSVAPTKALANQRDLALAYSPGVAYACLAIADNASEAANLTSRSNLVAVVSNGTAVLGLGNIGPLAGKPVMEGKGCLFKKFAGIDVFDLEIAETDPDRLVDIIASLEPTFGGINLEDIKAPECFYIERKLRERMNIPVFHDDQHGTAIIVAAAVLNGLKLVGKKIEEVKLAGSGAGAAAIACLDLLVNLGLRKENITIADSSGVVYAGREKGMNEDKMRYAQHTSARLLGDIIENADIFLGLSSAGALKPEMMAKMSERPLILALANPEPEIRPELAKQVRYDCIVATGRSDYPNQVNNVLCFPFLFRGALDAGAITINEQMKLACVRALSELAQEEPSDIVAAAFGNSDLSFGPDYLIPRPFDPRLILRIAPAVAKAAIDTGVATRPLPDLDAYRDQLTHFIYRSGTLMQPVFAVAKKSPKRVVYAEGENEQILRAVQVVVDEGLARPILIGREDVLEKRIQELNLRLKLHADFDAFNPEVDARYQHAYIEYHRLTERRGVSLESAKEEVRRQPTLAGAILLRRGDADAMLCGIHGSLPTHLSYIKNVVGRRAGVNHLATMNVLILPDRTLFVCDTYVNPDPTSEQIAEMTLLAAQEVARFGITPRVALLSHSSFGSSETESAIKMRDALEMIRKRNQDLEVEGEMHGDAALSIDILKHVFPNKRLTREANLLVMPNLDAANISFNLLKMAAGNGLTIGAILLGAARPVQILTPTATVRRIVNMTALATVASNSGSYQSH
jgi:malate dehydrogenase (oxaloacetate-decarboxylating)(NADP+)